MGEEFQECCGALASSDFSSTLGFSICSMMVPQEQQGSGSPVRRKEEQSLLLSQEAEPLGSKGRCSKSPPKKVPIRLSRLFSCPGCWS